MDLVNANENAEEKEEMKLMPKLQGVHNYDILANPFYAERYLYTPCVYPKRSTYAISKYKKGYSELRKASHDLVRIVVDLPYMSMKRAREMDFNVEYICMERRLRQEDKEMQDVFGSLFERKKTVRFGDGHEKQTRRKTIN